MKLILNSFENNIPTIILTGGPKHIPSEFIIREFANLELIEEVIALRIEEQTIITKRKAVLQQLKLEFEETRHEITDNGMYEIIKEKYPEAFI